MNAACVPVSSCEIEADFLQSQIAFNDVTTICQENIIIQN